MIGPLHFNDSSNETNPDQHKHLYDIDFVVCLFQLFFGRQERGDTPSFIDGLG